MAQPPFASCCWPARLPDAPPPARGRDPTAPSTPRRSSRDRDMSAEAYYQYSVAQILAQNGRFKDAIAPMQEALRRDPDSAYPVEPARAVAGARRSADRGAGRRPQGGAAVAQRGPVAPDAGRALPLAEELDRGRSGAGQGHRAEPRRGRGVPHARPLPGGAEGVRPRPRGPARGWSTASPRTSRPSSCSGAWRSRRRTGTKPSRASRAPSSSIPTTTAPGRRSDTCTSRSAAPTRRSRSIGGP